MLPTAPPKARLIRAPRIRTPRATTTATGAATRIDMRTATTTRIPATTPTTATTTLTATGTTLTPFISSSIATAFSIDSVDGTIGSTDIAGSTEVAGSGDVVELSSVMAGLAILGGSTVSVDVEETPSSLALEDPGVQPSREAASALAPKDLTRALSVLADSDLQAPHAAVFLMGSGDLGEASAVMVDSVIRVFQVVLTLAAASPAAHEWPPDRPEDAEGASGVLCRDRGQSFVIGLFRRARTVAARKYHPKRLTPGVPQPSITTPLRTVSQLIPRKSAGRPLADTQTQCGLCGPAMT